MEDFFKRRSRVMPPNNRKQAMLPTTAEVIDNPIGTACGFAVDIGRARFYFTPGVPRELRRMLEEQIDPAPARQGRLRRRRSSSSASIPTASASRMWTRCSPESRTLVPDGSVKLGFRAHYPQLETKLTVRGADMDDIRAQARAGRGARCASASATSSWPRTTRRSRASSCAELAQRQATLALVETFTSGQIAARLAHLPGAETVFRRGVVARDLRELCAAVGLDRRARRRAADAAGRRRRWRARRGARPAPRTPWRC